MGLGIEGRDAREIAKMKLDRTGQLLGQVTEVESGVENGAAAWVIRNFKRKCASQKWEMVSENKRFDFYQCLI